METINLTFLGTGDAVPTKRRSHTAILASFANETMLIDCGEGTQRQFRIADLNPMKITRMFITHWHGDHILGIPGLLQTLALNNYNKTMHIYVPRGTRGFIEAIFKLFIFVGKIKYEIHEITNGTIVNERDFRVETAEMHHGTPSNAYSIILKDKIKLDKKKLKKFKLPNTPLLKQLAQGKNIKFKGKTIKAKDVIYKEKGKKVTIVMDTSYNKNAIELAKNSDILITESSFAAEELARAEEFRHLTAPQAAEIAKKSKSKQLILTHISQRYEKHPEQILGEAKKIFKNTKLAKDLESLKI